MGRVRSQACVASAARSSKSWPSGTAHPEGVMGTVSAAGPKPAAPALSSNPRMSRTRGVYKAAGCVRGEPAARREPPPYQLSIGARYRPLSTQTVATCAGRCRPHLDRAARRGLSRRGAASRSHSAGLTAPHPGRSGRRRRASEIGVIRDRLESREPGAGQYIARAAIAWVLLEVLTRIVPIN